ncbi:hypothetical protein OAH87_05045 [Marinomonas sp.]|nr:hypothetical protein [Marinomonas sp.]MDB4837817.1 hypothetical protein [Marinomonas sp.]
MSKKMNCEIQVYDVLHCGLYETTETGQRSRKSGAKHVLLFPELINDLKFFAYDQNLKLGETCTYSVSPEIEPAYCFDFQKVGDSYLLALWNEVNMGDSGYQSLDGTQSVHGLKVKKQSKSPNNIPGFMTYFWIMPGKNKIATVKIWEGKRTSAPLGTRQFNQYIIGFFKNKCSHLLDYTDDNGEKCTGFSESPRLNSGTDRRVSNVRLKPFWATGYAKSEADISRLKDKCGDITAVMRDIKLKDIETVTQQELLNAMKTIFRVPPKELLKTKKFRFKGPVNGLNKSEINQFIDDYDANDYSDDYNMGFKISGEQSPIWLAGCFRKEEGTVTVDMRPNDNLPNVNSLLKSLKRNFRSL